jgi:phosphoglucomutase
MWIKMTFQLFVI